MGDTESVWETTWQERPPQAMPWEEGRPNAELVHLVESGRVGKGPALDICCGSAINALYLAEKGFICHGLDIAPTALAVAHRQAAEKGVACRLVKGDATHLPYPDSSFVLVFDRGGFHSIPPDDRAEYIRGIHRVLKPGGRYLLLAFSRKRGIETETSWAFNPKAIRSYFESLLTIDEMRELQPDKTGGRWMLCALMTRPLAA